MYARISALLRVLILVAVAATSVVFAGHAAAEGDPASAPSVELTNPNDATTWYAGDPCYVAANVVDADGLGYTEFWLSTDDGATFPIQLGRIVGGTSLDCYVPDVETTTARVKVIASDSLGNTASDVSDYAFTITARPVAADYLALSPTRVVGGNAVEGDLTLSGPAPAGGARVALASSNRSVTVPASVTVPEGESGVTFAISTSPVSAVTTARITASYGGYTVAATLTVTPPAVVGLYASALSLKPTTLIGGQGGMGTVKLSGPAPAGGATIALSSSDPAVAIVDGSVVVPDGETFAEFPISSVFGSPFTTVTISASYGGATVSAALTVTPEPPAPIAIVRADYTMQNGKLRVSAWSMSATETLSVYLTATGELIGTLRNVGDGDYVGKFNWPEHPLQITIRSDAGASATERVRARL